MILDFLANFGDTFRSEEQVEYRKALDNVINRSQIVVGENRYYLDKSYAPIRKEYHKLLKELSSRGSLKHSVIDDEEFHYSSPKVLFCGNDSNVRFKLEYSLSHSLLNMNFKPQHSYIHDIQGKAHNDGYIDILTIYTQPVPNSDGTGLISKTFINPGDYFTSKISTAPVENAITHLFTAAWKRKNIPTPDNEELKKIANHERYFLHLNH
jgi:hypothetical protein